MIKDIFPSGTLHFVKHYIAINVDGENRIWFHRRSGNKSLISFWFTEKAIDEAKELLDKVEISYTNKRQNIFLTMDAKSIKTHEATLNEFVKIFKRSWDE